MHENSTFQILSVDNILPNRFQPRIKFEDDSLNQLAESINKFGVIEPIVVRPVGDKFEIIAGERRYKASKLASKSTIPAIVLSLSDKDSEELALLENVQRQALNPIEEAVSYKRILDMGYITREELAKKIGKTQSVILNKIKLLNLSDEVQSYLLNNKISERHARALLNITNLDDQKEMLHRIVNERLTVKQTNREIRNYMDSSKEDVIKDDDTEKLFDDERGKKDMDIDRIMREAKDINPTEPQNNVSAPDLMAKGNDVQNEAIIREEQPSQNIISQEPNKFVSFAPIGESTPQPNMEFNNTNNGNATFDNMFNSSISTVNSQPMDNPSPMGNINPQPMDNPSPMSDINPQPMDNPSPMSDINPQPMDNPNPMSDINPQPMDNSNPMSDINPQPMDNSNPMSDINSQPIDNPNPTGNINVDNSTQVLGGDGTQSIPNFDINNLSDTQNNVQSTPAMTDTMSHVEPEVKSDISSIVSEALNSQNLPFQTSSNVNNIPDTNIINETDSMLTQEVNNLNNGASFVNPINTVENPTPVAPTLSEASPMPEANNINVSQNVPDFAQIVKNLRDLADDIEKSGHFVKLEEMDLDNQYKVIFTIDK